MIILDIRIFYIYICECVLVITISFEVKLFSFFFDLEINIYDNIRNEIFQTKIYLMLFVFSPDHNPV
jgi:hypothetical protein